MTNEDLLRAEVNYGEVDLFTVVTDFELDFDEFCYLASFVAGAICIVNRDGAGSFVDGGLVCLDIFAMN